MQQHTWFYSLDRSISGEEQAALAESFDAFLGQWNTHGDPVSGLIALRYGRFVVVRADPSGNRPSGCSISSMKEAVGQILQSKNLNWLEASEVFYRNSDDQIVHCHFQEISSRIEGGEMGPDTAIFDHTLGQSDDLDKWELPLKQTWLSRFLPKAKAGS